VTVLESQQPRPADDEGEDEPAAPSDPAPPAPEPTPADAGDTAAPGIGNGPVLAACLEEGGGGCLVINISVLDEAAGSCVELAVDNCGTFSRAGIPVDTPVTWRLGSASVGDLEEGCVPSAYDPDSAIIVDGSGSIGWNLDTRRPSDLVLDVSLEAAGGAVVPSPIGIAGTFAGAVPDCES